MTLFYLSILGFFFCQVSFRDMFGEIIHLRLAAMFHLSVELEPSVFLRCPDPPCTFLFLFSLYYFLSAHPYPFGTWITITLNILYPVVMPKSNQPYAHLLEGQRKLRAFRPFCNWEVRDTVGTVYSIWITWCME